MRDDVHVLRLPEPLRGSCELPVDRWFDHTVVDFPSMRALIDRMQADFFAGEADELRFSAEIELSPRRAFIGGPVPVDIPLRRLCRVCDGRGGLWDQSCRDCNGVGERVHVQPVLVLVPSGVRDGTRFRLRLRVPATWHLAVDLHVRVR